MDILCHRGFWENSTQKNTLKSFKKAFINDFGIEIDVRDLNEEIVISHDIPNIGNSKLEDLLMEDLHHDKTLAFNIKSDGISSKLKELIEKFNITKYFCFDMSVPQQLHYQKNQLIWYSRFSDHVEEQVINKDSDGVWLDCFYSDWWNGEDLKQIAQVKPVVIVSPELHGRNHHIMWKEIKNMGDLNNILLCTDLPEEAKSFFYD